MNQIAVGPSVAQQEADATKRAAERKAAAAKRERDLDRTIYDAYIDAVPARDGSKVREYFQLESFNLIAGDVLETSDLLLDYGNSGEVPALDALLVAIARSKPGEQLPEALVAPVRARLHGIVDRFMDLYESTHEFSDRHDQALEAAEVDRKIDALKG